MFVPLNLSVQVGEACKEFESGGKKVAHAPRDTVLAPRPHAKDLTNVAFNHSYPLFASCSDDCTAYVFHGVVYSDLNQNPLIVLMEIFLGHTTSNGRGVLDWKFHPKQPRLFTAGADSVIELDCH